MPEQRNAYKGSPFRPWIRIVLIADDGANRELELLADTGNPCALIIDTGVMLRFNQGVVPGMTTNFGRLDAGWLRVQIPDIGFDEDVLGYSSQLVVTSGHDSLGRSLLRGLSGTCAVRSLF